MQTAMRILGISQKLTNLVRIDDIGLTTRTKTIDLDQKHLKQISKRLKEYGLHINKDKTKYFETTAAKKNKKVTV